MGSDELRDALEESGVVAAVDDELGDARRLVDNRDLEPEAGVRLPRLRAENEFAVLCKQDPGPRAAAVLDEHRDDAPEHVVHVTAVVDDPFDRLERGGVHRSNAATWSRNESGTGSGRRSAGSMSTSVCFAVAMRTSSSARYAAWS